MSNQKYSEKKRLEWIDQSKGIAILGVVVFHFFQNFPSQLNLVHLLNRNGAKIGYAAVDIFFMISGFNIGYSLAQKANDYGEVSWFMWLKKRLFRLYPNYWLALLLTIVLYLLFSYPIKINLFPDLLSLISGITSYKNFQLINPGFWFFSVFVQFMILTPLLFKTSKYKPLIILWVGIIGGILTKIICLLLINNPNLFYVLLQNNLFFSYVFQFCLGIYWGYIYFEYKKFRKIDIYLTIIIFTLGIIGYVAISWQGIDIIYMLGFDLIFTPFFFLICYGICNLFNNPISSILTQLGKHSYELYLIHQPLYFVLLPWLSMNLKINAYIQLLTSLILTIFFLWIYVLLFINLNKLPKIILSLKKT